MAASVENSQFGRLDQAALPPQVSSGGAFAPSRRQDSHLRGCGFPQPLPSSATGASSPRSKKSTNFFRDSDGSDEDDDDDDYEEYIRALMATVRSSSEEPPAVDPRDEGTADNWVQRHPSLIRLTGKHPFNAEPPLESLMSHGFITPTPLHFVRNHGAVAKAAWEAWSVEVCGLVRRPRRFTMDNIAGDFPARELPVTLVCCGNRRKEQNMVKQSIGFNWGAAAVATGIWRGARLCDVLRRCGVMRKKAAAAPGGANPARINVCFEGDEDLPGGGGSKYGTSIPLEVAMDPANDILLAYAQNGEPLLPDHGFPVRMVIPGYIGGRMVKWLRRILVTTEDCRSYYHFRDNKVFPSHVDADLANADGWWYKQEYMICELNINSAITTPAHDEILPIGNVTAQRPYRMKGYAYSGGGKMVKRVEVTLDGGETWLQCDIDRPERPSKHGKYWCWCFWSVDVEVLDLLGAKELAVRAWDQALNTQPEKLIWNVLGMMNNCWFRVKVNVCRPSKGEIGLAFEHPTQPANLAGGWMGRRLLDSQPLKKSVSSPFMSTGAVDKYHSMSEVRRHSTRDSAWIVVHGHVYDCTPFLKDHPGGADSILINAGSDCTEDFDAIHSDKAKAMLESYRVGELIVTGYVSDTSNHGAANLLHLSTITEAPSPSLPPPVALIPREKIRCTLVEKTSLSHDVRRFRFALPCKDRVLGLPVGKHIFLSADVDGKPCMRAYTPTSGVDLVGHFDLVIKVYFRDVHPKFPRGGLMSQHLDSLPIGATVDVKGPVGHIEYLGRGAFLADGERKQAKRLAMIAGGTGITPIYQVMQAVLGDPDDRTEMHLVYACRSEADILLREELDGWAKERAAQVKVWYVVSEAREEEGWRYSVGFVREEVLREHVPAWADDVLALACGPPPMLQLAVVPNLEKMGYGVKSSLLQF